MRKSGQKLFVLLLGMVFSLLVLPVCALPTYSISTYPSLVGSVGSSANGINDSGQAIGYYDFYSKLTNKALLWSGGTAQDLGALSGETVCLGESINNSGEAVGYSFYSTENYHAVLWSQGTIQDLGILPGGIGSEAFGINSSGQVVGYAIDSSGVEYAVLWSGGTIQELGTLPGGVQNAALAINNFGLVVGYAYDSIGHFKPCLGAEQLSIFWEICQEE